MNLQRNSWAIIVIGVYGAVVIASGLWRFFSAEGGHTGLWFGIIMGGLGLTSSVLFFTRKALLANAIAWICICLVGGWFAYEALIKKGIGTAEPRQLIVIAISVITAIAMFVVTRKRS